MPVETQADTLPKVMIMLTLIGALVEVGQLVTHACAGEDADAT